MPAVSVGKARAFSVSLGLLLMAALLLPTLAAAWTMPVYLSAAGHNAYYTEVAVSADGDAVFAWTRFDGTDDRIQVRSRSASGVLSEVQTVSGAAQIPSDPHVDVDADGNAVLAWRYFDGANHRIQARARSATGVLSPVQILSRAGQDASGPRVAVDADGDAVIAWTRFDGADDRVQTRARSAAGTLSPIQTPSPAGEEAYQLKVAVDANANATFTWTGVDGTDDRILARARSATGSLSPVQVLSDDDASEPEVAVDPDGDALFTWTWSDGTNDRIQARARSAAGTLSPVQTLSRAGQDAAEPEVAVDDDGDAVFTWRRIAGTDERIVARTRSAAGALGAVQGLSRDNAYYPKVAVDADGDAVFTWVRWLGGDARIQARTLSAAGALGATQTLSEGGEDAFEPRVAIDDDGDAVVAWAREDGTNRRIQASAGP